MTRFEAKVKARTQDISDLTERVGGFLHDGGVDTRAAHHVGMILDELLTNLATHGGADDADAAVRISIEKERVFVEISDSGPPFDPRSTPDPDVAAPIEDRDIGGLGLFLMRKLASDIHYDRSEARNHTSFAISRS